MIKPWVGNNEDTEILKLARGLQLLTTHFSLDVRDGISKYGGDF
jgi:hypothetical protein